MSALIHYALEDGQVSGIYEGAPVEALGWQVQDTATGGSLLVAGELPASAQTVMQQYRVDLATETLVAKARVTMTATPAPFPADGTSVCQITVVPFVPCTLLMNGGSPVALIEEDRVLEFTSQVPGAFVFTLASQVAVWAEPLTVVAE